MQHSSCLFQVSPSVLILHSYRYKRPLLWFLLVLYSQIPLLLNLIFTKFDKHAKLQHYKESERKYPVELEPHEIRFFYSLLIVLAKNGKSQVTQFHSSHGFIESSVIDQKDLYNFDVNGKGNTTGHILWIKSLLAWSKLSHHLKEMLSPGVSQGSLGVCDQKKQNCEAPCSSAMQMKKVRTDKYQACKVTGP